MCVCLWATHKAGVSRVGSDVGSEGLVSIALPRFLCCTSVALADSASLQAPLRRHSKFSLRCCGSGCGLNPWTRSINTVYLEPDPFETGSQRP